MPSFQPCNARYNYCWRKVRPLWGRARRHNTTRSIVLSFVLLIRIAPNHITPSPSRIWDYRKHQLSTWQNSRNDAMTADSTITIFGLYLWRAVPKSRICDSAQPYTAEILSSAEGPMMPMHSRGGIRERGSKRKERKEKEKKEGKVEGKEKKGKKKRGKKQEGKGYTDFNPCSGFLL